MLIIEYGKFDVTYKIASKIQLVGCIEYDKAKLSCQHNIA